jgi:excisionase family DNA binding protein
MSEPGDILDEVKFLTVTEVADLMRVSKMTVYRLVHNGDIAAVRVGRSFRVPESAVKTYLSEALRAEERAGDGDPGRHREAREDAWEPGRRSQGSAQD